MIHEHETLQLLLEAYPECRDELVKNADYWIPKSGPVSACALFLHVTSVVQTRFVEGDYVHAEPLFALIERFISEGDERLSTAACTCFIESLQNAASHGNQFEFAHFVGLLGSKSMEHARAWDKFTGVKTEGL